MPMRARSLADPALLAGALAALLGLTVIAGWHFRIGALVHLREGLAPMQYITAICLLVAGGGQVALSLEWRRGVLLATALLAAAAGTTLLAYLADLRSSPFDCCPGIWPELSAQRVAVPGRMAPNTAVSFLLVAGALWAAQQRPRSSLSLVLAPTIFGLALMSLLGYATGSTGGYRWNAAAIGMAVHTAGGLLTLSLGLVLRRSPVLESAGTVSSTELRRRLMAQLSVGILMPAAAVAVLGLMPMMGELDRAHMAEAERILRRQALALNTEIEHGRALARQVASRQIVYETLWKLDEGHLGREAAAPVLRRNLKDAMSVEPAIAGIRVHAAAGGLLADAGVAADGLSLPADSGRPSDGGLAPVQQFGAQWLLPVIQSVPSRSGGRPAGFAVLLLRLDGIQAALLPPPSELGKTRMFLHLPGVRGPLTMEESGRISAAAAGAAAEGKMNLSQGLQSGGWVLNWSPDQDRVFAANRDLLVMTAAGIAVFLAVALASLLRSLSPLAGHIFLRAGVLERQVEETRLALARAEAESAQRLAAEREQYRSDSRYRALVEATQTAVWFTDGEGQISRPMPSWERFTGQTWEQYRGFGGFGAIHPEDSGRLQAEWVAAGQSGQFSSTYRLRNVDGSYHQVQSRGIALRDEQGRICEWIGSVQDIQPLVDAEAELRRLNAELEQRVELRTQQLERSNSELQQFAYAASHDLKSPLRSIGSFAGLLLRRFGAALPESAREIVEAIREASVQGQQLVEDLLTLARIEADQPPRQDPVRIEELLRAVGTLLTPAGRQRPALSWGPMPVVCGDAAEISQVLHNLVGNGFKFQPRAIGHVPAVHVEAERAPDGWCIRVRDNGIGIAPERRQQIFQMFKRLHPQDLYRGSGLGLAICRKIIERHGGRIWAEAADGAGSCFVFTLPGLATADSQDQSSEGRSA